MSKRTIRGTEFVPLASRPVYDGPRYEDPVEVSTDEILAIFDAIEAEDEIAKIDRMIDENSRDAARTRSKAQWRGFRENIDRLETERDRLIERAAAKGSQP